MTTRWNGRYWRNLLVFTVVVLSLGLTGGLTRLSYQAALSYVHPPRTPPADTPARWGVAYQDLDLLTEDGVTLKAWYTPPQNGVVILVAHGYPGQRHSDLYALFARHGFGVLAWDARALGESGGDLCTFGYYEARDVQAALDYARRQPGVQHVGGYGQSMGAATLLHAAAQMPGIEAVAADSAFPALNEMIGQAVKVAFLRPLIQFFAERETGLAASAMWPVDEIGRISPRPVFLIQGTADTVVPADSAERLYAAAGEPRQLWLGAGVVHVGMYTAQPAEYERRVIGFFQAALGGP